MRVAAGLLLAAAAAAAQEAELAEERFADALRLAEERLRERPRDAGLLEHRARAILGLARDAQRREGYRAALDLLGRDLSHPVLAQGYADVAVWAGEEERALAALRTRGAAAPARAPAALMLLGQLGRFREAEALAREAARSSSASPGDARYFAEWEAWERDRAELRERLRGRARRAGAVAAGTAVALAAAVVALFRLAPARASGRAAARGG
jgi:hypothetical protein